MLVEFGDNQYPGPALPGAAAGRQHAPTSRVRVHNEIPAPNRAVDNTTLWQADYNQAHYEDMYFNRMAEYYETQSSGRYSVDGTSPSGSRCRSTRRATAATTAATSSATRPGP